MLAFSIFTWWYGQGWSAVAKNISQILSGISKLFSVPLLMRTLFAPWRRIITYPGASLDTKLRAYGDNIVSRAIGFMVRLLVLLTALVATILAILYGVLVLILWPIIPLAAIAAIIRGVVG